MKNLHDEADKQRRERGARLIGDTLRLLDKYKKEDSGMRVVIEQASVEVEDLNEKDAFDDDLRKSLDEAKMLADNLQDRNDHLSKELANTVPQARFDKAEKELVNQYHTIRSLRAKLVEADEKYRASCDGCDRLNGLEKMRAMASRLQSDNNNLTRQFNDTIDRLREERNKADRDHADALNKLDEIKALLP